MALRLSSFMLDSTKTISVCTLMLMFTDYAWLNSEKGTQTMHIYSCLWKTAALFCSDVQLGRY